MRIKNRYEHEIEKYRGQRNLACASAFVFFVLFILTLMAAH